MSGQIFISYRRDDSSPWAGRLYDDLDRHFVSNQIFMDVDTIQPGVDFVEAVEKSVGYCDALIAVIGKRWLISSDEEGARRLDNPEDSVRIEILTALKRGVRVIPVLVDGATMPRSRDLPDDLKSLARRNALEVSHNRFRTDSKRLIAAVEQALESARKRDENERLEETGLLPSDPASRKVILILQEHDLEKCSYEGVTQFLLDEEACVLQFPVSTQGKVSSALQNIRDAGLICVNHVLIQNPYNPDIYEDAALAPQRYALEKHMHFSTFCKHLGAKEVRVEQVTLQTGNRKWTIDAKGIRLGTLAKLKATSEALEKFRAQMTLRDEFAGGPPDFVAAERLLQQRRLLADANMQTLLEMRRYGPNQLCTREMDLSLSSEAQKNLNVAGRLKIPAFVKLSAEYDRVVHEQYDYTLRVLVRF
jgi:hypothetical protein